MATKLAFANLLSPPILFFFLGTTAVFIRSDLTLPHSLTKFIALYLLFSIGFRGGLALAHEAWDQDVILTLGIGILMSMLTPLYVFFLLKNKLKVHDAGAIAATYGSISAVTFITASSFLSDLAISYGGHMIALMALMESPAIIIGVLLIRIYGQSAARQAYTSVFKEALTNSSVVMLLGSLLIGFVSNPQEAQSLQPFTVGIFKGMLTFFLLDMGLVVGKNMKALRAAGISLIFLAMLVPIVNATIGIILTYYLGIAIGDSLLLVVLLASASYIAVPAALRLAVPQANPSLYLPLSLAITFPFNIVVGIPLYYYLIRWLSHLG